MPMYSTYIKGIHDKLCYLRRLLKTIWYLLKTSKIKCIQEPTL